MEKFCGSCGTKMDITAQYCPACGNACEKADLQEETLPKVQEKNKWSQKVLAIPFLDCSSSECSINAYSINHRWSFYQLSTYNRMCIYVVADS